MKAFQALFKFRPKTKKKVPDTGADSSLAEQFADQLSILNALHKAYGSSVHAMLFKHKNTKEKAPNTFVKQAASGEGH